MKTVFIGGRCLSRSSAPAVPAETTLAAGRPGTFPSISPEKITGSIGKKSDRLCGAGPAV